MARRKQKERKYSSARKRGEEHGKTQSNTVAKPQEMKWFSVSKQGTIRLDIIPYEVQEATSYVEPGDLHYEKTFWVHRGIGPNQQDYVCPRKQWGKKCPICEYRSRLMNDPNADEEAIKSLVPKERQLWYVIDTDNREAGVQLWDMSFHLFGKVLQDQLDNSDMEDEYDKFFHLEDGLTVRVGMKEKKFGGRSYYEAGAVDFKPRREQYEDAILDGLPSLDSLIIETPYDKLKAAFLSADQDGENDDEDEDEDEPVAKGRKSQSVDEDEDEDIEDDCVACDGRGKNSKGKDCVPCKGTGKSQKVEDVWDDDDEEEEDEPPKKQSRKKPDPVEDDDDDEPPKKKTRKASKPAVEDEDEDEPPKKSSKKSVVDDDEEEEEDELPKKKAKATAAKQAKKDDDWDDWDDED